MNGNGWRKTNLTAPGSLIEADKDFPIAPPRRKRSSLLVTNQHGGFKEVFGNTSRRSSSDSILSDQKRVSNAFLNAYSIEHSDVYVLPVPEPVTTSAAAELLTATTTTITVPRVHHRLQRKVSRVGNKKSDKFFGENLSDCLSDEPVTPESDIEITKNVTQFDAMLDKDKIDEFIDENVVKVKDTKTTKTVNEQNRNLIDEVDKQLPKDNELGKRAEFFISMLENTDKKIENEPIPPKRRISRSISLQMETVEVPTVKEDMKKTETIAATPESEGDLEKYEGMTPVEEPIIVPRRRHSKHICDDDEIIQHKLQKKPNDSPEHHANREVILNDLNDQIITPQKPKRDFIAYEKSLAEKNDAEIEEKSISVKQGTTIEVKPLPRKRHLSQGNLLHAAEKLNSEKKRPEPALRKSNSQQSFFAQELIRKLNKADGFQDAYDIHDMHHMCDDGSAAAAPQSKLTTRKISAVRKVSTVVPPIFENLIEEKPIQIEIKRTETSSLEGPVKIATNIESAKVLSKPTQQDVQLIQSSDKENLKRSESGSSIDNSIILDNIIRVQSQMRDSQRIIQFIDTERDNSRIETTEDLVRPPTPPVPIANNNIEVLKTDSESNVLDSIYAAHTSVLDEFQKYFDEPSERASIANSLTESSIHSDSLTSSDETGSDITVKEVKIDQSETKKSDDIRNKLIEKIVENGNGRRRDSINDVDEWFLKHKDYLLPERRGSTNSIVYDTRTVFPFGKPDPGAGTKFFEGQNDINGNKIDANEEKASEEDQAEHSTLLKYLDTNEK